MLSNRSPAWSLLMVVAALAAACNDTSEAPLGDGGEVNLGDGGDSSDGGSPADAGFIMVGEVALSASAIDFGAVVLSSTASQTLVISNPQSNALRVSLTPPSGPDADRFLTALDVTQEGNSFVLEPGAQATLTVTFSPREARRFLATLALDSCQGECPSSIVIQAEGVLTGVVCPQAQDLGLANVDTCISAQVTCDNVGNATERVSSVALAPDADPAFTLTPISTPVSLQPGDSLSLELSFCPTAFGALTASLNVVTDQPSDVSRTVSVSATAGGPDIECSPAAVDFGPAGLGGDLRRTLQCRNRGADPLEITGTLSGDPDFSVVLSPTSPLAAGASEGFELSFVPTSLGAKQATLQVLSNDPDSPSLTFMITGEAVDLLPCAVDPQPASLDFGLVSVGERRQASLAFSNVGVTDCVITGFNNAPNASGALTVGVASSQVSLAPGDTLTLPVTFAPTAPGVATSSVTLSFANPGSSDLSVGLRGEGGTPQLSVTPNPVDFGDVAVGCAQAEARTVTIRRTAQGFGRITAVQLVQSGTTAFSANPGPLPQNLGFFQTLDVEVTFTPPGNGVFAAQLRIISEGSAPLVVPIQGRGAATAARTDTLSLTRAPVDVLFVVDDSCSMGAAQAALGASMQTFVNAFASRGVDFQIGVVTTDMNDTTKSGRLQGTPTFLTPNSPNLLDALSARMQPGTGGSGTEQGIRAALSATTPPLANTSNAGFLRPSADLAVVIISDENDTSQGGLTIPDYLNGLRGAAGTGELWLSGIVGPATGNCNGPYGNAGAATRYAELIESTLTGLRLSYCDDMLSNLLMISGALFGQDVVPLSATPVINTLAVSVNGVAVPRLGAGGGANWAYDRANNAVIFIDASVLPQGATVTVGYDAFCLSGSCGDGTPDPNEQCDDGNGDNSDACINCNDAVCGDAFVQAGVEACDDGNLIETDDCLSGCTAAACGDGFVQAGVEECDDGNTLNADACPATCFYYQPSALTPFAYTEFTNGTALTFTGSNNPNDDGTAQVTLPFAWPFFSGTATTAITVSPNGLIAFGAINPAQSYSNQGIPDAATPNGIIAGWWDDLLIDAQIPGGAEVSWLTQGTAPNRVFIVQWRDVRVANQSTFNHRRFSFQIQLEEAGTVRLAYGNTEIGGQPRTVTSASAGLEDGSGTLGYEALGCSPTCDGPARTAQRPSGFPEQSAVTFTP